MRRGTSPNDMTFPPRVLDHMDSLSQILDADRVGLFSDFDGTLTPIFDDPRDTVLSQAIRNILAELSKKFDVVAVVSGRDVGFLRDAIGLNSVTYVGNHGLEMCKAGGAMEYLAQVPDGLLEDMEELVGGIGISGLYVENKGLSVAVHYRNAPDPGTAGPTALELLKPLAAARGLKIRSGKMVLEVVPASGVNKGTAVARLAREFELTGAIAVGDDVTDCDAFDALHGLIREDGLKGAAIAVVDEETPESVLRKADYCLSGLREMEQFLRWMAYKSPRAAMKL